MVYCRYGLILRERSIGRGLILTIRHFTRTSLTPASQPELDVVSTQVSTSGRLYLVTPPTAMVTIAMVNSPCGILITITTPRLMTITPSITLDVGPTLC
jgi:hypothetical protein